MPLLIDGYNLLHVSGVFGRGTALTELHRSREALLAFLASSMETPERSHTTIVFDAAGAPPGLPRTFAHEGITVHFARDPGNADAMLEDLIAAHGAPRSLTVVSSDHRVQRAARRRKAKAIDSDLWWAELCAKRRRGADPSPVPQKPGDHLSPTEVDYWLRQFADAPSDELPPRSEMQPRDDVDNPFPPGYGDDLLDELER